MKKALCLLCVAALLSSCAEKKWEYKTVSIDNKSNGAFSYPTFDNPENKLNSLGKDGWEVVGTYTEINTVFPNFGKEEFVTGIRTNTSTGTVTFVLKREANSFKRHLSE